MAQPIRRPRLSQAQFNFVDKMCKTKLGKLTLSRQGSRLVLVDGLNIAQASRQIGISDEAGAIRRELIRLCKAHEQLLEMSAEYRSLGVDQ
ncbi:hypothetical protein [Chromobacterium haemolyticum]|uniref:hypothetical protein n=1 Tax=Chromobacterium haemolyticum TaxID=394935 RepID=UPI0011773ECC|nr:hypothetical protein [Chromobacterium haemolyticum]